MYATQQATSYAAFAEPIPNQEVECVLAAARKELEALLQQRSAISTRIARVRRTIDGLMETFGDVVTDDHLRRPIRRAKLETRQKGLTTACRAVLSESREALSAIDVAERVLSNHATVLRNHKNSISSVTTVLRRLQSYGEATAKFSESGQRVWLWCTPQPESHSAQP